MAHPWISRTAFGLLAVAAGIGFVVPVAASTTMTINVTLPLIGDNGRGLDGRRFYLLPVEMTTETGPEAAVCVSTDVGETACAPTPGKDASPCPDSYRCTLKVTLERPFTNFTVSVFDIDGVPQDIAEMSQGVLTRGQTALQEATGWEVPDVAGHLESSSAHMVWTWVESASFVQGVEFGERYVADTGAEAIARAVAEGLAPWYRPRFARGRIAAPFTVMAYEECEAGLPPCVFDYVQISIDMEEVE
jgi:hypothetical protein